MSLLSTCVFMGAVQTGRVAARLLVPAPEPVWAIQISGIQIDRPVNCELIVCERSTTVWDSSVDAMRAENSANPAPECSRPGGPALSQVSAVIRPWASGSRPGGPALSQVSAAIRPWASGSRPGGPALSQVSAVIRPWTHATARGRRSPGESFAKAGPQKLPGR